MDSELARFESVYRETYGLITAYAARRCDSPQDAADVRALAEADVHFVPEGRLAPAEGQHL